MTRKFRKGDRVLVPGEVIQPDFDEGLVHVAFVEGMSGWGGKAHVAIDPAVLIMKEAAPPQVGDLVIHKANTAETFKVLAFDGDWAWVRSEGDGRRLTFLLANLDVVRAC